jgi:hypothetical protein
VNVLDLIHFWKRSSSSDLWLLWLPELDVLSSRFRFKRILGRLNLGSKLLPSQLQWLVFIICATRSFPFSFRRSALPQQQGTLSQGHESGFLLPFTPAGGAPTVAGAPPESVCIGAGAGKASVAIKP